MHRYKVGDKVRVIDADVQDADYCLKFFANKSYDGKVFEIVELQDCEENEIPEYVCLLIPMEVGMEHREDDEEFTWWFHVDALSPHYGDFFENVRPRAPKKGQRQI